MTTHDAKDPTSLRRFAPLAALVVMLLAAVVYLRIQGRVWWCACGVPNPISLHIDSHNSQHLFDIYSFSHVLHGVLFFGLLWLVARRFTMAQRFLAAIAIEIGWELMENSPMIIERYRAATVSLGYTGDSIANSLGDIASCAIGFYLAKRLGLWWSVAIFVAFEAFMLWAIRDNLATNVLMLLWPIEAVRKWQTGS